jgi:hypothetical protein
MNCSNCTQQLEPASKFCRHCGKAVEEVPVDADLAGEQPAQNPRNGIFQTKYLVIGAVAFTALNLTIAGTLNSQQSKQDRTPATIAAAAAATDAMAGSPIDPGAATQTGTASWTYSTDEDRVRGATTYYATTTSTNTIAQAPPYEAATSMTLTVRKSPADGMNVMFRVSSGQLMCVSFDTCSATVRFDDGPAQTLSFIGAADNSSEVMFVQSAGSFIAKLKKAKRLIVEKTMFQAGSPQFEFDVSGLKWEH